MAVSQNGASIWARISILAPNNLTQYTRREIPAHFLSLAASRGSEQGPVCPNASAEAAARGLPMRFCQTPHRSWWLWIDSSAVTVSLSCRKGQPNYPAYPGSEPPSCQMALRVGQHTLKQTIQLLNATFQRDARPACGRRDRATSSILAPMPRLREMCWVMNRASVLRKACGTASNGIGRPCSRAQRLSLAFLP